MDHYDEVQTRFSTVFQRLIAPLIILRDAAVVGASPQNHVKG